MGYDLNRLRFGAASDTLTIATLSPAIIPTIFPVDRRIWRKRIGEVRREVREAVDLRPFEKPDFFTSCWIALRSHTAIGALAAGWLGLSMVSPAAAIPAYPVVALLVARQQRVLELLVHDGSHYSFSRDKRLNDGASDSLAAWAVLQRTAKYRLSHAVHHSQFGADRDPCRDRDAMMILRHASGQPLTRRLNAALGAFPLYMREYYGSVTALDVRTIAFTAMWHLIMMVALWTAFGAGTAFGGWALMWLIPFAIFLPWIRMNAEADEHDYGAGCEVAGTFTNKGGWNWLYHPDGDEYHLAHHCFPAVPIQRLARLDREARRVSPLYACTVIRRHR